MPKISGGAPETSLTVNVTVLDLIVTIPAKQRAKIYALTKRCGAKSEGHLFLKAIVMLETLSSEDLKRVKVKLTSKTGRNFVLGRELLFGEKKSAPTK